MLLETVCGYHVIDALDRALMDLLNGIHGPGVYKARDWIVNVTSFGGSSTAVLSAPGSIADRLHACLTAYAADTEKHEYKRIFRDNFQALWVCECTNES